MTISFWIGFVFLGGFEKLCWIQCEAEDSRFSDILFPSQRPGAKLKMYDDDWLLVGSGLAPALGLIAT